MRISAGSGLFLLVLFTSSLLGDQTSKAKWIDLTYPFNNVTITWPTDLAFSHIKLFANFTADGYYFALYDISGSEHSGTHLDAPRHFAAGGWTTDQIPLERLIGPAIKIDVSSKATQVLLVDSLQ